MVAEPIYAGAAASTASSSPGKRASRSSRRSDTRRCVPTARVEVRPASRRTRYTLGASEYPTFSSLRFTALTAALGWPAIALATAVVTAAGLEPRPSLASIAGVWPQIAYITVLGGAVAVVTWNSAVGLIGPQNTALFGNLIPITTFAIEIARGYRPNMVEILGAAMTVGALVLANVVARRRAAAPAALRGVEQALPEAA
jgi:hypothetical protein